jgi:FkbM family methyltransferase
LLDFIHHKVRTTPWLGRFVLKSIPNVKWNVEIEPIGKFTIRLREHRMFWLRSPLMEEGFMLGALNRLIRAGDVVYDVGANIGLYSRFMIQCFNAAHVYAFEPSSSNRRLLEENVNVAESKSRVTVMPCAIGNQDGLADFQVDDLTSNTGTLDAVAHGGASESRTQYGLPPAITRVPIHQLDTLIETKEIALPDVVKVDVEGAEAMALHGANHLLSTRKPRLAVELHGAEVARQALQILWSHGYHCFGRLEAKQVQTYKEIVPADLPDITHRYSLSYIACSVNEEDVKTPIENYKTTLANQAPQPV